jgi:hypothetical protein
MNFKELTLEYISNLKVGSTFTAEEIAIDVCTCRNKPDHPSNGCLGGCLKNVIQSLRVVNNDLLQKSIMITRTSKLGRGSKAEFLVTSTTQE